MPATMSQDGHPCFARTYEGLKPHRGVVGGVVAGRFARTYEGLKLIEEDFPLEDVLTISFARTYEGLKRAPVVPSPPCPRCTVLPVPMRD